MHVSAGKEQGGGGGGGGIASLIDALWVYIYNLSQEYIHEPTLFDL